jgi:beta-glucosidase
LVSFIEGLTNRIPEGIKVEYRPGCQWATSSTQTLNWAIGEAGENDLTIACMGTAPMMEGEEGESIMSTNGGDRIDICLPEVQVNFIKRLAASGAKIILVLSGGSPIALGEVEDLVEAVLFAWYPGQEGGHALAEVLFGDFFPSGKLPITFPRSLDQLPPFDDYSMAQRTYRYSDAEPLYPFGFGIGYTQFNYLSLELGKSNLRRGENQTASIVIKNKGNITGEEVVQVYLSTPGTLPNVPKHSLISFQRVELLAGEQKRIEFTITPEMLSVYNVNGKLVQESGQFHIEVGGCSPGKRGQELGAPKPLQGEFSVY